MFSADMSIVLVGTAADIDHLIKRKIGMMARIQTLKYYMPDWSKITLPTIIEFFDNFLE